MRFLPPPANVPDQPVALERGGVLDAPWVGPTYLDRNYPIMPSNAPRAHGVPPNRHGRPMPFARLSADGLGQPFITAPLGPAPTRAIQPYQRHSPVEHIPERYGIFSAPWLAASIDAGPVEDLASAVPGWVRMQEQARVITGPPPAVGSLATAYPTRLLPGSTVFRRR